MEDSSPLGELLINYLDTRCKSIFEEPDKSCCSHKPLPVEERRKLFISDILRGKLCVFYQIITFILVACRSSRPQSVHSNYRQSGEWTIYQTEHCPSSCGKMVQSHGDQDRRADHLQRAAASF